MSISISEAKSVFSSVFELYKKGSNIEAEQKLQEIQEAFIDLKAENLELKERIQDINEKNRIQQNLTFEEFYYYLVNGANKDGPFCQRCYDADRKLIRLIKSSSTRGSHVCKECENFYGKGRLPKF